MEWSKSQARKMRWEEEVQIIQEEMRWTIIYYEWREQWWLKQDVRQATSDDSIRHGLTAYSHKQAYYCRCLGESFAIAWLPFLQSVDIKREWEHRYGHLISGKKSGSTASVSLGVENETSEDENNEGELEEEPEERYDAFELDD